MIKQRYTYAFFYDNYKYRHHNMFRNYYRRLEEKYRYFILAKKDINENNTDVYRSNKDIGDILKEIDNMDYMSVEIKCVQNKFPDVTEYLYTKVDDFKQITKIYRNNLSQTRRMYDNELIYMSYTNHYKRVTSALIDAWNYIRVAYDGYIITSHNNEGIKVFKSVPLSQGIYLKYDSAHREMVEKVLRLIIKDNVNGFYDEMISKISNEFGIR